jgi:hypothetical protein
MTLLVPGGLLKLEKRGKRAILGMTTNFYDDTFGTLEKVHERYNDFEDRVCIRNTTVITVAV